MQQKQKWVEACRVSDLIKNSGICSLVEGQQIAMFDIQMDEQRSVFAIANRDPIGQANVLYRGIIGSVGDQYVVASPLYKQRYSLSSGECLDDSHYKISVYPTRVDGERVFVQLTSVEA